MEKITDILNQILEEHENIGDVQEHVSVLESDDEDEPPESIFYSLVDDAVAGDSDRVPMDVFVYRDDETHYALFIVGGTTIGAATFRNEEVTVIGPGALAAHGAIHVTTDQCDVWRAFFETNIADDEDEREARGVLALLRKPDKDQMN